MKNWKNREFPKCKITCISKYHESQSLLIGRQMDVTFHFISIYSIESNRNYCVNHCTSEQSSFFFVCLFVGENDEIFNFNPKSQLAAHHCLLTQCILASWVWNISYKTGLIVFNYKSSVWLWITTSDIAISFIAASFWIICNGMPTLYEFIKLKKKKKIQTY